jgi:hypothetical protein
VVASHALNWGNIQDAFPNTERLSIHFCLEDNKLFVYNGFSEYRNIRRKLTELNIENYDSYVVFYLICHEHRFQLKITVKREDFSDCDEDIINEFADTFSSKCYMESAGHCIHMKGFLRQVQKQLCSQPLEVILSCPLLLRKSEDSLMSRESEFSSVQPFQSDDTLSDPFRALDQLY